MISLKEKIGAIPCKKVNLRFSCLDWERSSKYEEDEFFSLLKNIYLVISNKKKKNFSFYLISFFAKCDNLGDLRLQELNDRTNLQCTKNKSFIGRSCENCSTKYFFFLIRIMQNSMNKRYFSSSSHSVTYQNFVPYKIISFCICTYVSPKNSNDFVIHYY